MAWMPIAEAAARLGVSERTIWRRIKAEAIESRNENGRTLVVYEEPSGDADPVRPLSHVSAAPFSVPNLDADAIAEALDTLGEFRDAFAKEIARHRRMTRFVGSIAAVFALLLGAGVWYHVNTLSKVREQHMIETASLESNHRDTLVQDAKELAHAKGELDAQASVFSTLQARTDAYQHRVAELESSRDALQCTVDDRLDALTDQISTQQLAGADRTADQSRMNQTIDELRAALQDKDHNFQTAQLQQERIIAALRRHAARDAGMAEGLKMQVAIQQDAMARMRDELSELHTVLAQTPQAQETIADRTLRQELQASLLRDTGDANASVAEPASAAELLQRASAFVRRWFDARLRRLEESPANADAHHTDLDAAAKSDSIVEIEMTLASDDGQPTFARAQ